MTDISYDASADAVYITDCAPARLTGREETWPVHPNDVDADEPHRSAIEIVSARMVLGAKRTGTKHGPASASATNQVDQPNHRPTLDVSRLSPPATAKR